MDRQTRKDLKTDKFAAEVVDSFAWATEHKDKVVRYGTIAVAVIVVAVGVSVFLSSRADTRQKALAEAQRTVDASVGTEPANPAGLHYATPAEKDSAVTKVYTDLAAKYSGTEEGSIAEMALAAQSVDKGNLPEAEKRYKNVVDNAPKSYAALARIALAHVLTSEGKNADAQKILQDAVNNPTNTVSKEYATIELARAMAPNNKAEALKMLDKLRTSSRIPVGGAASQAYSEIDSAGKK